MKCLILLFLIGFIGMNAEMIYGDIQSLILTSEKSDYFVNDSFETTLKFENAENLVGFQMKLNYDETKYQVSFKANHLFSLLYNLSNPGEILITYANQNAPIQDSTNIITFIVSVLVPCEVGVLSPLFTLDDDYHHEFIHKDSVDELTYLGLSNELGLTQRRLLGDLNLDDQITIMDVLMMQLYLAEAIVLEGLSYQALQFYQGSTLTITDIVNVQRYITGTGSSPFIAP